MPDNGQLSATSNRTRTKLSCAFATGVATCAICAIYRGGESVIWEKILLLVIPTQTLG